MKKIFISGLCLVVIIPFLSCENSSKQEISESRNYTANLFVTDNKLIFKTDSVTPASSDCLFAHDIGGKRYLSYLNKSNNEIVIFDIDSQQQLYKIKPEKEGAQGVGTINGFYFSSFDSIYICPKSKKSIFIIDKESKLLKTINYGKNGDQPIPSPKSFTNLPLLIENNKVFLPSFPFGNWSNYNSLSEVPLCYMVNISNNDSRYLNMTYPEGYLNKGNTEPTYGRIKVGSKFIYSFFADHYIYITKDHREVKKLMASSEFFEEFKYLKKNPDMQEYSKFRCETPYYSSIIYDKNRKVYYRFTSLGVEIETNDNLALISRFSPNASIIILDSLLNKIGETKLPFGRFNISNYFVTNEGLYVSENNPMNENYLDENLNFTLLKLSYNEK